MSLPLREKFYGCIAGSHIGSAMGAAVEPWPYSKIVETYGFLDKLLPYEHYNNGWIREPGTTEDGIERQKLMITAIIEKGNRVNAEDVRTAWLNHANPEAGGLVSEPFERTLFAIAKSGIPARDIGKYCDYAGLNTFARACHPIGLINAGNIDTAIEDILEVGQLYQTSNSKGLKWACVVGVGIAAATKPGATVDSVLGAIYDNCDKEIVVGEIDHHLTKTQAITDVIELREYFDDIYNGIGIPYFCSYANEVVTKSVLIFRMVKGNTKDAILSGVNLGRDTDCIAAIAAGLSGALTGTGSLPSEWIRQVDYAASVNPHTCVRRTLSENSDGLYNAFKNRIRREKEFIALMDVD